MDDDLFSRDYGTRRHGSDNLFAWTVFILLLTGFAIACWLGSFYIFGHPEYPRSYAILKRLKKIEPPKRFELTAAPTGEFLPAEKIYDKYSAMSDSELQRENGELLRNYLTNYQETKKLVPYLVGRYTILDSYELKTGDLFPSGVVALAQSADSQQILVEHIYTADPSSVTLLQKMLMTGLDIKLERTLDLSAIIHVERLEDGRLLVTAVPLLYGTYALKQGTGSFSLQPPQDVHLETGAPIIRQATLQQAEKVFADYRKLNAPRATSPVENTAAEPVADATPPANAELVRVMPPVAMPTPKQTKTKPIAIASPSPTAKPKPTEIVRATPASTAAPTATPHLVAANTTPLPLPTAPPFETPAPVIPEATPAVAAAHPNVTLQPFLQAAKPTPALSSNAAGSWTTYRPGQMPRGRLVSVTDANDLADRGLGGEKLYLQGRFVVTAAGESRAVLRSQGGVILNALGKPASAPTRIIVEFPAGSQPPDEGSSVARDDLRPFEVRDVRRGTDGQINIYVREVTTPQ
jgi:hypothetical protein